LVRQGGENTRAQTARADNGAPPDQTAEPGLSPFQIDRLAGWYIEQAAAQLHERAARINAQLDETEPREATPDSTELDYIHLDAGLRQVLAEQCLPEFIELELDRVKRRALELGACDSVKPQAEARKSSARGASIPFMITRAMKYQLHDRGLSDDQIANLTPQEAHEILNRPAE